MSIKWLQLREDRQKGDFLSLARILTKFPKDSLYQTEFLNSLTNEYWMEFLKFIVWRALVPWILYSTQTLIYFAHTLEREEDSG